MKNSKADLISKRIDKARSDKTYEYCCMCWTKTNVKKNTPLDLRYYYVDGVGQLCPKCHTKLYK